MNFPARDLPILDHRMPMVESIVSSRCQATSVKIAFGALWFVWFALLSGFAQAQTERLIRQDPSDRIVLNAANGGQVLETLPLDLPDRKVPEPQPTTGMIRCRLVTNPEEEIEVDWAGIERIELFEKQILREAQRKIAKRQFDEAFEDLTYLRDRYPKVDGLDAAVDILLYAEATALYQAKQFERAWLLLDEVHRKTPERKGLATAMARVLDVIFQSDLKAANYSEALRRYRMAEDRYAKLVPDLLEKWKDRLEKIAEKYRVETQGHLDANRLREAYLSSRLMMSAWPDLANARSLATTSAQRYPLLRVAVNELLPANASATVHSMLDWPHRRTQRLTKRVMCELTSVGSDGGVYQSPLGQVSLAEDMRSLVFKTPVQEGTLALASQIAQHWLSMADEANPAYSESWAALVDHIEPRDLSTVAAVFRRPCLRPEAFLDVGIDVGGDEWTPYRSVHSTESDCSYLIQPSYRLGSATQPREVLEQMFSTPQRALGALRRGEVDLVDRVFPSDVVMLQKDPEVVVTAYRIPTLHALLPNPQRPFPANRIFRRALLYGIDREKILHRDLLGGTALAGCRLISGPFSPGVDEDDSLAYANDARIEPRSYDPRHARTLIQLAQIEINSIAQKRKQTPPSLEEIILVHPQHEIARVACQEIVEDLEVLGLKCKLKALAAGQEISTDGPWDLRYVDYIMPEPIHGAQVLLSTTGISSNRSPHLQLALRQLDQVSNWNDAGDRLRVVHQLVYDETAIIPLWQLVDFMVYRKGMRGIPSQPMSTYQAIEAWQLPSNP